MVLLSDSAGPDVIRMFSLARHALLEALRVIRISPGEKVLVPAFICRELLAPIHTLGAVPLFYATDRTFAPLSLPSAPEVKAVLAVNYFGFPQRLEPFRAYCEGREAALIEDNAHGYLSRDGQGKLLGSRGDIGIFSLRKSVALPDGAALVLNRPDWVGRLAPPLPCRGDPLPVAFMAKRALNRIQNATGLRVRNLGEGITRQLRRLRTGQALPKSALNAEADAPGPAAMHCESLRMLGNIDAPGEVARRRALYADFQRKLSRLDIEPVFGELPQGVAPYGFPFRADGDSAAAVVRVARKMGFDCGQWPELPTAVAPAAPDYYRNVFWVNFLC